MYFSSQCREKVHIPENKLYVFLRGNGKGRTSIVWSQSSPNNVEYATVQVEAPHFIAFGISFKSREIFVVADCRVQIHGSITAQNRQSGDENSGFVFIKGKVYGIGDVYLGRARGAYSRVIFAKTYISKTIDLEGWTNWSYNGSTEFRSRDIRFFQSDMGSNQCTLWCIHHFGGSDVANGLSAETVIDSPLITQKIGTNRTIKVDLDGKGDFTSVQAAIDSVPEGNSRWIIIHVRKGVYREKVHIPENKPYVFLRGNGKGRTSIVWSQSSPNNVESATVKVEAPHFIAFGISFKNDAPTGLAQTSQNQSVAVFVGADMAAFYHCGFYSAHNTLFDYKGRHYYDNCYIQGSIDFIFGRGRSVFHSCEIFVVADCRVQIHGSITAQNRQSGDENSGFVFIKGKVYGIGDVYLGRARGAYSRVIFAKTYISKTIDLEGWTNWSYDGSTENLFHAEYHCHGPGAVAEKRAPWSLQLTEKEATPFMDIDFIDGKEWLPVYL
ncbi:hypothetical protein HHK36_026302 [Tetracentron sinense]|uniref:Pectinesterase n=1 Tax=Tetracentron sinense TaxID=13715 RepID=A0A835D242_TETSI|nr:hypothetical protein HHK36_026302 [Tetracentron sinense]